MSDPIAAHAAALRATLDEQLAARDRAGAVLAAVETVRSGDLGVLELERLVLAPLMIDTGAAWQSGEIQVWEEHFASATVRTIVDALYPDVVALAREAEPTGWSVVLACPPEEEHDLGLRMLADRFEIAGWATYFLGADTPVGEIADAAREFSADLIVLSGATHFHRVRMRHVIDELADVVPSARVVVGGAAFERERADWPASELFDDRVLAEGPAARASAAGANESQGGGA